MALVNLVTSVFLVHQHKLGVARICEDLRGSARAIVRHPRDRNQAARICEDLRGSARICEAKFGVMCVSLRRWFDGFG